MNIELCIENELYEFMNKGRLTQTDGKEATVVIMGKATREKFFGDKKEYAGLYIMVSSFAPEGQIFFTNEETIFGFNDVEWKGEKY